MKFLLKNKSRPSGWLHKKLFQTLSLTDILNFLEMTKMFESHIQKKTYRYFLKYVQNTSDVSGIPRYYLIISKYLLKCKKKISK